MGGLSFPSSTPSLFSQSPLELYFLLLLYWCSLPLFCVHMLIFTFGVQACPIDPYLEWLGVAGKAHGHGHGPVRRRIPYYCVGCFFPGPALTLILFLSLGI